jgi:hypothetical protein
MSTTRDAWMLGLTMMGCALAQHPVPPTTANGMYDMTGSNPIAIGSCTGEGTGCTTVYGFDWLSDGRMVLLTNDYLGHDQKPANRARAKVSIISGYPDGPLTTTDISTFYKQPGGIKVVNDKIWVSDMDSVYVIPNNAPTMTGNTATDSVTLRNNKTPRFGTPLSTMYGGNSAPYNFAFNKSTCSGLTCNSSNSQAHHYVMTPIYYQGKFYAAYGGATSSGGGTANLNASSFYASAVLMWDSTTTSLDSTANRFAGGLRSPDGTAIGPGNSFFVTDHQGSWLPMNTITRYKFNASKMQFGGYRQDGGFSANWAQAWYDRGDADYVPPVAINRYDQSGKTGWVGIAQPYYLTLGTYAGQILVGDINSRGLWRVALDTLNDTTGAENVQGAVFYFTPGNSGNTLGTGNAGNNRLTQGPDGTIYAGGGRGVGNWGGGAAANLIYVFKPAVSSDQFEVMKIRSLSDGYELYLSQKVNPSTVTTGNFSVGQRNWVRQSAYGMGFSPTNTGNTMTGASNFTSRSVTSVSVSDDSLRIRLVVSGIQRINQGRRGDSVTHWHTRFLFNTNLKSSTGTTIYTTEADYTQNWISSRTWDATGGITALRGSARGMLENNVWSKAGRGSLRVHVDNMTKPYAIFLHDLRGREVFRRTDIPSGTSMTEITAPGSAQSVYTLQVRVGSERASKIVTF